MKIPAKIIATLLQQYKTATTEMEQDYLNEALLNLIRRCENLVEIEASEAAIELYRSIRSNSKVDIRSMGWKDVSKARRLKGKFMFEHYVPVNQIREELLAIRKPTINVIAKILSKTRIIWVTKAEDVKLSKAGYRRLRANPAKAYKDCGIIIAK